jgi:hypothetical protein
MFSASVVVFSLAVVWPSQCHAWSLSNPFVSSTKTDTKSLKSATTRTAKKPPSTLDKIGAGTKNVFDRAGQTLGLKKPAPKKISLQYARPKSYNSPESKREEPKSGLFSWMQPEEPKKHETVTDWMSNPRLDP